MIRFHSKYITDPITGCWNWISTKSRGYGQFRDNGKYVGAHRFSYRLWVGPIPEGECVLHKCDNRSCVNPKHLILGSYQDNYDDMILKGRQNFLRGKEHSCSKLTEQQVLNIRKDTRVHRLIAHEYGIDRSTVGYIKSHKLWSHL